MPIGHNLGAGISDPPMPELPIVEKLLAVDSASDELGDDVCTNSYRNPDGPQAAAIIKELVEALDALDTFCRSGTGNAEELLNKSAAALAAAREG